MRHSQPFFVVHHECQVMRSHLKLVPAPQVSLSQLGYENALSGVVTIAKQGLDP